MKLRKLHLYGFGRFQDFQIELADQPLHIFLGENEAGKSTIMAFIRCILFGFPTKQQTELRYEPRLGGRYGGSIVLETKEFGKVTIERVHGKATGDAKIYFADGSIGGENELKLVLNEIDRTIFSAIYSFGLTDLQTMEQLHSDELNKFMYGVGISGRNNLLEIEKKNDKVLQTLYKPTGRKPVINEQLRKVNDLEEKISAWRKKLSQHDQLVKERNEINAMIEKTMEEDRTLNRNYRYFEKLQSISSVILNKKMYESRLQQLPVFSPFPEDGLQRLEKNLDSLVLIEGEIIDIETKIKQICLEKENYQVNENVNELQEAIDQIKESRKIYQVKRDEIALLLQQIQFEENEYEVLKEKLGYKNVSFKTGVVVEQKLASLIEEEAAIKQRDFYLHSQLDQVRTSLESKEAEINLLKQQVLDDQTKKELEQKVDKQRSEKELEQELRYVDGSLQLINQQLNQIKANESSLKKPIIFISVLLSLIGGFFLLQYSQVYLAIVLFIVMVSILLLLAADKKKSKKMHNSLLADLTNQNEKLTLQRATTIADIQKQRQTHDNHDHEMLLRDQLKREQLRFKEQGLKEINEQYEHICKELDQLEFTTAAFQEKLQSWALEFNYPISLEAETYVKLLKIMEEVKKKQRQLHYLKEKLATFHSEIEEFEAKVEAMCKKLSIPVSSFYQNIEKLSLYLKKQQETEKILHRLGDRENQLIENLRAAETKLSQFKKEINKLYQLANVKSEDEFRQKGKAWLESQQIQEQIRIYNSQISPLVHQEAELIQLESDVVQYQDVLNEKLGQLKKNMIEIRDQLNREHEKLAKVNQTIEDMEEGTNYSHALHNFENEKGILNAEIKKWAFHRTVQLLIEEAKKVYEKERQPQVIKEATNMFQFMTDGQYVQLFAPIGEQRLYVERCDGIKFQPNELSQGTKEQLYLAIRLALAKIHSKQNAFPIFLDDIFVNFDIKRRSKAIELIKEISNDHQVIFFTCHPFMAEEVSTHHFTLKVAEHSVL
ncbi:AAA family ATPase [Anaerobacillus sp. CMMVII]|uniref:ATP-binding protein n=1 Tax=Anaerobacillus sp. CMMVII TaxID=2755588 RepID=UPI0021B7B6CC|nr:AAA family ATPase [Anaerobacillus sp. CMMVII]MCT8139488.1 AAA family ATPase [Anaerobacillus sp. CMMVII]